jgi:hypothetical protein
MSEFEDHLRFLDDHMRYGLSTVACGISGLDHPGQEMHARVLRVDDVPLRWRVEGRCAFATDFDYRSQ